MSKIFPTTFVNEGSIAAVINVAPEFAGTVPPPKGLGFTLVRGTLVSHSFRDEVESQLQYERLNCWEVTTVNSLFTQHFLDSLTAVQQDVLGDVVMLLIEKGSVPITLVINSKEAV
jgi:hypothetical protein